MVKVTLIYAGHQLDYLIGLISGVSNNSEIKITLVDTKRTSKVISENDNISLKSFLMPKQNNIILEMLRWSIYYLRLTIHLIFTSNDIIHVEWINRKIDVFEHFYFVWIKRILKKKLVFKIHDIDTNILLSSKSKYNMGLKRSTLYFLRHCDLLFVHNNFVKNIIINNGIDETRIKLLKPWHGVNQVPPVTKLSKKEAQNYLGLKPLKTILFFGNLRPYKGIIELLEICSDLHNKHINFQIIIAGKNDIKNKEMRNIISQKIGNLLASGKLFYYPEFIENKNIEIYFKASDLLVLPYKFIFQSGVPFLSYNFGTPILSSDVGGLKEDIIQNCTGLSVKLEDFTQTLEMFIKEKIQFWNSEKIQFIMSKELNWNKVIKNYIENYEQL